MRAAPDVVGALRAGRRGLWERLWFGAAPLVRLDAFRIVALTMALYALRFHRKGLVQVDAANEFVSRRFVPVYFLELLGVGPMSPEVARTLYVVLFTLVVLGLVGLFTRVVCALVAAGMLFWVGTAYSYGQPHHEYGVLAFALCALPFGPVGARLSLDAVLRRRRAAARTPGAPLPTAPELGEGACLPLRFVQVTLGLSYLFAGLSKLAIGGSEWLNGYTLQGFMLEFDAALTDAIAANLPLLRAMSWGVIGIQVFSFVAVLWRPARWVFVPAIVALHLGSRYTMDTGSFFGLWAFQAAFVDWERVPDFLARRALRGTLVKRVVWIVLVALTALGLVALYLEKGPAGVPWLFLPLALAGVLALVPRARVDLVFDGGCGICRRTVVAVDAADWAGRVRLLPTTDWDAVAALHPALELADCLADVHLVDAHGRVFRGFAAYRQLAWRLPLAAPLAPLLYLPGVPALGERVYRHVADGRATTSCDG